MGIDGNSIPFYSFTNLQFSYPGEMKTGLRPRFFDSCKSVSFQSLQTK